MRRRTWLTGVGLVLALGPGASSAMADPSDVRRSTTQLLISEFEPVPPATEGPNAITVSQSGGSYTIVDTAGAVARSSCTQIDITTVTCPATGIGGVVVQLKGGDDQLTFENNVTVPTSVSAGPGNDTVSGGTGADAIRGEAGRDTIRGNAGNDTIDTQGTITDAEADLINCGAGTDTATIDLRDGFEPAGTTGECETIQRPTDPTQPPPPPPGGGGPSINQPVVNPLVPGQNPTVPIPPAPASIACRNQTFLGTAAADRFIGTGGGDRMVGQGGNDLMDGLAGEDCLFGQDGADTMRGGDGDDRVSGGNGNDRGDGGAGADTLFGSAGVDTLYGRAGNDVLSGGLGSDRLYGEAGNDRVTGSAGNDRLSTGAGNDRIVAGTGRDVVIAGSGNDLIDVRDGARDVVSCGPGRDTVVRDRRDVLRNCERTASRLPRAR
jgi:Ca2+-binding RTX toxin-like protein